MVRYELVGSDLADVRFAISPLNEVVLSLRAWRDPGRFPLHLRWVRSVDESRSALDHETLLALTDSRLWTPDFLNPRPASPLTRFDDELASLATIDPALMARDLRAVHGAGALRGPAPRVLSRIIDALAGYWRRCFTPHWPRMRALLEGDVTFRARQISQHGLAAMFNGLSPQVRLVDATVEVRLRSRLRYTRSTNGGLTLVPSLWTINASTPISEAEPPMIIYAARGVATLWEPQPLAAPGALAALLGAVRAGLLVTLETPASSTELASRLGVTPTAINQHLRALRDGGLLVGVRDGRSVLYRRSPLGDRLVAPDPAAGPG
ncbi:ArsR/SmtB family transcription factor [Dactylosporangium matsuzakiense]|uniref:Transcriptional regulator n=1 Tax=Dactylosporangium matsuzakiense TaxID=53360 RepID=A0A9W6KFA1_9ACTN|nr:helix-turn-helix domain-containing protein [Dactylosporangium matsuzakiense]UWZ42042.1 helix-turn-helix transcriptional regulator [Dactylosporangium matsuzakiense]GLK99658.1 transcriptional regulator [Dactylosporangium matsuzakiense]